MVTSTTAFGLDSRLLPPTSRLLTRSFRDYSHVISNYHHHDAQYSHRHRSTRLYEVRCDNKYYQLEELEDKETCTTELFLKPDRTIEFGETDGPLWTAASGIWQVVPDTNDFTMRLTRSYTTGSSSRPMGEFTYTVERRFSGEITLVGESIAISGAVYVKISDDDDEINEITAGYFNMIDATAERLGDDKKVP